MPALAIWAAVQRMGAGAMSFLGKLNVWQLLLIASLLIGGVQTLRLHSEQRHNVKLEAQLSKEVAARQADRDAYQKAQTDAKAQNIAQVQEVERQYQRNSDNERQAYLSDRAKLIAYYDGLRAHRAPQGSPGAAPSSPDRPAGAGADGNGLQVPPADDLQTRQDAAEIELRLLHLQQYVMGLLAIDPNTGAAPK